MATWSRSEKTRKTVSYTVPAPWPQGATWTEVLNALDAARREIHEVTSRQSLGDDALWVKAEDDRIVIYFEMPGKPGVDDELGAESVTPEFREQAEEFMQRNDETLRRLSD